jgi:hypothetical protein
VRYPEPVPWHAQIDGTDAALPTYQNGARFEVPVAVAADAAPGRYRVGLNVRFQPCGERECLAPEERRAEVTVEVVAPAGGAA